MTRTVFDVGMYDGADTAYYLAKGHRVVAVEANPELAAQARVRFAAAIAAGRLVVENVAVAESAGPAMLEMPAHDSGSAAVGAGRFAAEAVAQTFVVDGVPFADLLARHGVPHYLKIDIEGGDGLCVKALTPAARPDYVSFEMGDDAVDLAGHLRDLGYAGFKIISQTSFGQLGRHGLDFRLRRRLSRLTGRPEPTHFSADGWSFRFGHSSGPMGEATAGVWQDFAAMREEWRRYREERAWDIGGWFDLHARLAG